MFRAKLTALFAEHNVWLKHSLFFSLPTIYKPDSGSQTHYPEVDREGTQNQAFLMLK